METSVLQKSTKLRHPLFEIWDAFRANRGAYVGLIVIGIIALSAIFATYVAPHQPAEQYRDAFLVPPVWIEGGTSKYILGTDDIGRDILSRIIYGAQVSLSTGAMVVLSSLLAGILLGLISAFNQGVIDIAIMRLMDVMLALPSLLMAIVIVAILGPSLVNAAMAVIIVQLPHFVRLTRAAALAELGKDYVVASTVAGAGVLRLMWITVLPNCMAPLIVQATLGFSSAILDLAALGFLGMGAQPPTPEWGTMLSSALQFIQRAWWVVTFPGLAILIVVLAFNLMGDGLRDALDPKLKS
ncbi:MAG: ABC transporter permease subunit [Gammaproteobacteria bacterium]|nr:ABC transporter permease subunit [Gammaproteobacteria bacterium]MBT3723424.1 ABC transporter permease subunit [Gammaproteobacteria bacterium]MBT4077665.1 ABC transporter permease subunit [Gammaproteobacteria bacterium]MBT4196330.1 ABC transporter permease subunit [Gammaproteobacteria bacterium]MBT4452408.1 ABC transporter permease subunit [Gammaproteobacteria bacterium]